MKKLIYLWAVVILTSGCAAAQITISRDKLNGLAVGLSKDEIRLKLGKPSFSFYCAVYKKAEDKKMVKQEVPLEWFVYSIAKENKYRVLYLYKDTLMQIEEMTGKIFGFDKKGGFGVVNKIPPIKFRMD